MSTNVIPYPTTTTTTLGAYLFRLYKGLVTVRSNPTTSVSANSSSYTTVGTLPSQFRPKEDQYIPISYGPAANIMGMIRIQTTGDVSLLSETAVTNVQSYVNAAYYTI